MDQILDHEICPLWRAHYPKRLDDARSRTLMFALCRLILQDNVGNAEADDLLIKSNFRVMRCPVRAGLEPPWMLKSSLNGKRSLWTNLKGWNLQITNCGGWRE